MQCPRCGGLMVQEPFMDMLDTSADFVGGRCLICGEILDTGIIENRSRMGRERHAVADLKRPVPA